MSDVTIRPAYSKWPEYVLDADALVAALDSTFAIVERCLDLTPVVDLIPARVEIVAASDDERLGTGAVAIHHHRSKLVELTWSIITLYSIATGLYWLWFRASDRHRLATRLAA